MFLDDNPILFWCSIAAAALGVLSAIVLATMAFLAPQMSWPYDEDVRDFAKRLLTRKGLGDSFFTAEEYAEQTGHDGDDSPNSAANMLRAMNRRL